jgi:hypothetical protein
MAKKADWVEKNKGKLIFNPTQISLGINIQSPHPANPTSQQV